VTAVRRPWLPGCLTAHGLTVDDVRALSYVVVDEIVGHDLTLVVSPWPAADERGRLRFDVGAGRSVTVDVTALDRALYAGWLRRPPRIGDVFGAPVPDEPAWTGALHELLPGPVYDLSAEARVVAKLAYHGATSDLLPASAVDDWLLAGRRDDRARPAPRRERLRAGARG
jgi:hypothetical protein